MTRSKRPRKSKTSARHTDCPGPEECPGCDVCKPEKLLSPEELERLYSAVRANSTEKFVPYPEHVVFAWKVGPESVGRKPSEPGQGGSVVFQRHNDFNWDKTAEPYGVLLSQCVDPANITKMSWDNMPVFPSWYADGKSFVLFELVWPGYLHHPWLVHIPVLGEGGNILTRKELVHLIAIQYRDFAKACSNDVISCKEPEWRIGPGGYAFEDMLITTFWNLTEDVWRATIKVKTERDGYATDTASYYNLSGAEGCYRRIVPEKPSEGTTSVPFDARCPTCWKIHEEE